MIIKESDELYRITNPFDSTVDDRIVDVYSLRNMLSRVWTEAQLDELTSQEIGYTTPKPYGVYR